MSYLFNVLLRKVESKSFLHNWQNLTYEEKVANKTFQLMLSSLLAGGISLYGGDGSEKFMDKIAAGIAVARRNVQRTTFIIFRGGNQCWMICESPGNTGIVVDDAHVEAYGITEEQLVGIIDNLTQNDIYTSEKPSIYDALKRLAEKYNDLWDKYKSTFSEKTYQKIKNVVM